MLTHKWQRRQNILRHLSIASIVLSASAFIITLLEYLEKGSHYRGLSPFIILGITIFFGLIFFGNKRNLTKVASLSFIIFYFCLNTFFVWKWSASLPMPIIIYALIIILAGILLGTGASLVLTTLTATVLIGATTLQAKGIINPNLYWRSSNVEIGDKIPEIIILIIICCVIWLYNKEVGKSFKRANRANHKLKEERSLLAFRVAEKEREIKELHLEKMADIYKLAEIGRTSSSIFHDLMNPLTAVSLNLQKIKDEKSQEYLKDALVATAKMEDFIMAIKQHIRQEEKQQTFSLNQEITQVLQIMHHRLLTNRVAVKLIAPEIINTYGSRHKFDQIIFNLISNAIDAYDTIIAQDKIIKINLQLENNTIKLVVQDFGSGIKPENLDKIWEIFFSTKNSQYSGSGIGLSCTKKIIDDDFNGQISVESRPGEGAKFTCRFPQIHEKHQ